MQYHFSLSWTFVGILVTAAGFVMVRFYKQIADNFGWGVNSYQKYQLVGVGLCVVGILMIFNLHTLLLDLIGNLFFGSMKR